MIHTCIPLRPRTEVLCEYLVTPISVISETPGKKVLCLSDNRGIKDSSCSASSYIEVIREKVGSPDDVVKDSNPDFLEFATPLIKDGLRPYVEKQKLWTCSCGYYEELDGVRMFDLRRVKNNICTLCKTKLNTAEENVLMADLKWPALYDFGCNRKWAAKDLENFLSRQARRQKISKKVEKGRMLLGEHDFGIRYQILWAALIVYLVVVNNDNDITIHYVNKVQDKVFYVSSLAKMMFPAININLKALPVIWLDDSSTTITRCSSSQVKLLGKGLSTKRKELKLSLRSWRY